MNLAVKAMERLLKKIHKKLDFIMKFYAKSIRENIIVKNYSVS